ncbi:MAG: hypothetical protein RL514_3764 [Verrucomicrobiota bacterium]|jgi:hypothetical protein
MAQNLISQTMTNEQLAALLGDLTAFDTKFANYKIELEPDDLAKLARINESGLATLEMAQTYAQQTPNAIPGSVNLVEFGKDIALARQIIQIKLRLIQLLDYVSTALIVTLSDAYKTALLIYNIAKAQGRTPQNEAFIDAFGERFARGPQTPPAPPANPNP